MEVGYNLLAKYLINNILIPKGEAAGLIPEEEFCSRKYHIAAEVALCRQLFWDQLRQLRGPGVLEPMDS